MRRIIAATNKNRFSDGGICWCCRRRSDGIGKYLARPERIVWSCYDHIKLSEKAISMPAKDYDHYETKALIAAGDVAGAYLEEIGKFDLSQLSIDEYREYSRRMIDGFAVELEKQVSSYEAPF